MATRQPSYGSLNRIQDPLVQQALRPILDRLAALEERVTVLESQSLRAASPIDGQDQRLARLADAVAGQDAVTLRQLRRELQTGIAQYAGTAASFIGRPTVGPTPAAGLAVLNRGFSRNGTRYDWRGISAFPLLWYYLNGQALTARGYLDWFAANGVTVPRILMSMWSNGYWAIPGNKGIRPQDYPDYYDRLRDLLTDCATRSLCPQMILFGDCHNVYTTAGERQLQTSFFAQFFKSGNYPVFIQTANEPDQINMGNQESIDLVATYKGIDPTRVCSSGGAHSGNQSSHGLFFNVSPNDYLTFHSLRRVDYNGWGWVYQLFTYPQVSQTDRPPIDDEPMNAGPVGIPDSFDNDPSHWYGYALCSRVVRFSETFHHDLGFRTGQPPPNDGTLACFNAWKQGLDDMDFDGEGDQLWGYTAGGPYGDTPFAGLSGALLVAGRHNGTSGQGVVIGVPGGWVPSAAPGWAITVATSTGSCRRVTVVRA